MEKNCRSIWDCKLIFLAELLSTESENIDNSNVSIRGVNASMY